MPGASLPSLPRASARAIQFDRRRLRWPEWVVAASALVLLIVMFVMNWYAVPLKYTGPGTKYYPQPVSVNGWHGVSHLRWLLLVTVIVAFALFLLQATRRAPAVPVTFSLFVTFLSGLSVVWLIVRVAADPPGGRCAGGWVGLVAAGVLTWGGWRSLRMEGIAPTDAPAHIPTVPLTAQEESPSSDRS